jgi:hypothetical protein
MFLDYVHAVIRVEHLLAVHCVEHLPVVLRAFC